MDKHGKSGSFIGRHRWRTTIDSPRSSFSSPKLPRKSSSPGPDINNIAQLSDSNDELQDESIPEDVDHDQILVEMERFTDELSTADEKSTTPPEIPDVIETFSLIIKSKTRKSSSTHRNNSSSINVTDFVVMPRDELDTTFLYESVTLLFRLKRALARFPNVDIYTSILDRMNKLLHRSIMFMEEELRFLLLQQQQQHYCKPIEPEPGPSLKVMSSRHFSFKTDRCPSRSRSTVPTPPPPVDDTTDDYPGISEEKMMRITKIITTMISVGYRNECSHVYSMARGNAFYEQLKKLDFEKLNAEDVRLNWEVLEPDVARWIGIIKHCSDILIPAERNLGDTVFGQKNVTVFRGLFINLVRSVITSLVDYAKAVAVNTATQQTAEKLFRFLDMYEALYGLGQVMMMTDTNTNKEEEEEEEEHPKSRRSNDLNTEISLVKDLIGDAAVNMFGDLENSIRNDAAKTPVPGGAVHPLSRYVLNYVKYACDYGDTLEQIFRHKKQQQPTSTNMNMNTNTTTRTEEDRDMDKSPLAVQVMSVMGVLDGNLALKSTLYRDPSLRFIFLMNNGRYILTKVRESTEIRKLVGDNWCRRRSSEVRHYHKSYQRETWTKLLQCITQEGIQQQVNGKVNKQVLKERFKNFNAMFDEIHKTQSTWVVREPQLLSELRASISSVVIPAYRSFVGRYKHHFEPGKSVDKYIKYQPEDIEAAIETLFDGTNINNASMSRKRF